MTSTAPTSPQPSTTQRGRTAVVAVVAIVAAVLVAAVAWYLFRPAPAAVDIAAAVDAVASTDDTATSEGAGGSAQEVDGTWSVDTSIGTFSVTETTGTFVGFRIDEELASIGATEAIGRTPSVTGSLTLDGTTLTEAAFTADLTAMVSDETMREDDIQDALGTSANPTATFLLSEPIELNAVPVEGEPIEVEATGALTVNGVTREVTVPLQAALTDGVLVVAGSVDVALADFDVTKPTSPAVVSLADVATIELQLYLSR